MSDALVRVEDVSRSYPSGDYTVTALRQVDLTVHPGTLVVVKGRSGSGKTTLLNIIGGLDRPDTGTVHVAGHDVTALDPAGLVDLRRRRIGFVFQSFGLIPVLTAAENVGLTLRLLRTPVAEREDRVRLALALVGLEQQAQQRPDELSGGQQQRVAIARALVNRPALIIADEPTGQLDSATGRAIMQLLQALVRDAGTTALVATHDPTFISLADDVYDLHDGQLRRTSLADRSV